MFKKCSKKKKKSTRKTENRKHVPMIKPHFHIRLHVITLVSVMLQGMDDMRENICFNFFNVYYGMSPMHIPNKSLQLYLKFQRRIDCAAQDMV